MSYSTKQKDLIINVVKSKNKEFTIKELYLDLNKSVGLTTIYRLVDKLVSDGLINKSIDGNNTYYEYLEKCLEDNHFYLKCEKCKKLEHVDCDCIEELYNHINKKHRFKLNKENIVINGICNKCGGNKLC